MNCNLSKSEEELLEVLWNRKCWISCSDLVEHFNHTGKEWKRQTINTFLTRLIEKGFVIKSGRKYIYAYSKEEFGAMKAKDLIETLYDGSLKNFIVSLTGKQKIDKAFADELKSYLEENED